MLLAAGSNAHGQLSNNTFDDSHLFSPCSFFGAPPGTVPTGRKLLHLAFGANHTLALLEVTTGSVNELWGCGDGKAGQLGAAYTNSAVLKPLDLALERNGLPGYQPRLVAAAWETTYVVLSRQNKPDVLVSMGANDFGDLGIGAERGEKLPAQDFHVVAFDHLLNEDLLIVELLASGEHHVILKLRTASGDLLVGWGASRQNQLGDVEKPLLSSPTIISATLHNDPILSAALGHQHTVFLRSSGNISGLGSNKRGQLESLESIAGAKSVHCTWNGTYIQTGTERAWQLLSAGSSAKGQLGRLNSEEIPLDRVGFPFPSATCQLLQFACGSEHVLASFLTAEPNPTIEVWGWGWNEHGNLGIGLTDDVHLPVKIWPLKPPHVPYTEVRIWAGSGTSWIFVQ